jgi:methylphosphotriester-DNA--protein-cysteine methyltransferase
VQPGGEIDEVSAFFHGWRMEVIPLAPHSDAAVPGDSFRSQHVLRLRTAAALAVRGTVLHGGTCVMMSASESAPIRLLGQPLRPEDLVIAGPGARVDVLVPGGAELLILVAESDGSIPLRTLRICDTTRAHDDAEPIVRYLREPYRHVTEMDSSLAEHLRHLMTLSKTLRTDQGAGTLRVSAVVSACRLVERRFPAALMLSDLAKHCRVAERTLEYGFRQVYGTTPLAFIRSQRLARSRSALLSAKGHTSVGQTARAFGFTHMGQYSRDYRRLFGETPSNTLARGQSTQGKVSLPAAVERALQRE